MKIGLQIPDFTTPAGPARLGADLATVARTADDAGFEFLAVMDHFFQIGAIGPPEREMREAYTPLGYLAGCTSRAKLLTLVTGAVYRRPGMLAKIVTTLDVLSRGRAMLGIGAAWYDREHAGLGVPFPSTSERFERLAEALEVVELMWAGEGGSSFIPTTPKPSIAASPACCRTSRPQASRSTISTPIRAASKTSSWAFFRGGDEPLRHPRHLSLRDGSYRTHAPSSTPSHGCIRKSATAPGRRSVRRRRSQCRVQGQCWMWMAPASRIRGNDRRRPDHDCRPMWRLPS